MRARTIGSLRACIWGCDDGDDACFTTWGEEHLEGIASWNAVYGCQATLCNDECATSWPDSAPCGGLGMSSTATDCQPCAETSCCDEMSAMAMSAEFWARNSCMGACDDGDTDCYELCTATYPNGTAVFLWGESWLQSSCTTECEVEQAPVCGNTFYADPAKACPVCLETICCTQESACWGEFECLRAAVCKDLCGDDTTCQDACATTHPDGFTALEASTTCVETNCASECDGAAGAAGAGGSRRRGGRWRHLTCSHLKSHAPNHPNQRWR